LIFLKADIPLRIKSESYVFHIKSKAEIQDFQKSKQKQKATIKLRI